MLQKNLKPEQSYLITLTQKGNALGILPTGFGKSQIYAHLAHTHNFKTLVIQPLKSLIYEQEERYNGTAYTGDISYKSKQKIRYQLEHSLVSKCLMFATPETFFHNFLLFESAFDIIVFDEAHCIFESDFRPKYKEVYELCKTSSKKFLFLTGSLTPPQQENLLKDFNPKVISLPTQRSNVSYHFYQLPKLNKDVLADHITPGHRTIIYTRTATDCIDIASFLNQKFQKLDYALPYYSKLSVSEKDLAFSKFEAGTSPILVSTTATSMGIDFTSVRLIINFDMPLGINDFIQKAGRAGRDNAPASVITLTNYCSPHRLFQFFKEKVSIDEIASAYNFIKNY